MATPGRPSGACKARISCRAPISRGCLVIRPSPPRDRSVTQQGIGSWSPAGLDRAALMGFPLRRRCRRRSRGSPVEPGCGLLREAILPQGVGSLPPLFGGKGVAEEVGGGGEGSFVGRGCRLQREARLARGGLLTSCWGAAGVAEEAGGSSAWRGFWLRREARRARREEVLVLGGMAEEAGSARGGSIGPGF